MISISYKETAMHDLDALLKKMGLTKEEKEIVKHEIKEFDLSGLSDNDLTLLVDQLLSDL